MDYSQDILRTALHCGFDNCGILAADALSGFGTLLAARIQNVPSSAGFYGNMKSFAPITERYPWAKSLIICTYEYGKYCYPSSLQGRYGKAFFLYPEEGKEYGFQQKKFEQWLTENGIRWDGMNSFPLRYAAAEAGLGIIRKNNFFYTENGSYVALIGYVTDYDGTLIHQCKVKPCIEACNLCQKACKTKALSAPHTLDPMRCVSFWTTFGKGNIPPYLNEDMFEEWICGCDNCQDVCPYNRKHNWDIGDSFGDLDQIASILEPENLLEQSDEFIKEQVIPRTDNHLSPNDSGVLRKNVERALRYRASQNPKR